MGKKSKEKRERKAEQAKGTIIGRIKDHRSMYARAWEKGNASKFAEGGHYGWMASFLDGYDTVLEIGTGTGQGTIALLEKGHTVISIDENPECLKIAVKNLAAAGKEVTYEAREGMSISGYGYSIEYPAPEESLIEGGALLLDGDIINDPELIEWLSKISSIDAVVCWLIGTHDARPANTVFLSKRVNNPGEYRLCVQNHVYEIADKILRPGGVLHIVDRGEEPKEEFLIEDIMSAHRDQAKVTSMEVESLDYRLYEESIDPKKIPMGVTLGLSGRIPQNYKRALVSIISRKPL